jgi:hypothetical protein
MAAAAIIALSGGSALAATPAWTLVRSPNVNGTPQDNHLSGVSCVGKAFCMAVGDIDGTSSDKTLIQKWNGTSWATVSSPDPGTGSFLNAVSCTSTSFCMAVGSYGTGTAAPTLVEKWNGSKWSKLTSPNPGTPGGNGLDGVSCASTTSCMAVGSSVVSSTATPLAEKWNGTSWTLTTLPDDTLASSRLDGVSCASATFCMAVGVGHTGTDDQTVAEKWNGTAWALMTYQEPAGTVDVLAGVSCTSATFCMAAGSSSDAGGVNPGQTLIVKWSGKGWKAVSSANTSQAQANQLNAVSCTSSSFCTAVGQYTNGSHEQATLAQKWNGTGWSITKTPDTGATQFNLLSGVSCPSASLCVSAGYYTGSLDFDQVLAQKWNGTSWSKTPIQSAGTPSDNSLNGVSCAGTAFCMAVGSYSNGANDQALAQKWNGTSWATVLSGAPPSTDLNGVSCVSHSFCMAVGSFFNGTAARSLTEKWNGSTWSKVTAPDTSPAAANILSGVSCTSATFCMAVGTFFDGTNSQTLALKWNGTKWTLLTPPDTSSTQNNNPTGVSCASATRCMAVGLVGPASQSMTLAQKWNGASWTMLTSPDPGTAVNILAGVSCTSATFCMAAGTSGDTTSSEQPLTVTWNGTSLKTVAPAGNDTDQLATVSCTSSTFCMAAGARDGAGPSQTLAQKWNGASWATVKSPDKGTSSNFLGSVSCTGPAFCMSAGGYFAASLDRTLTEKW